VNERGSRRLSQAISEGDGISVLVEVNDPSAAQAAEEQGADGVVVRASGAGVRGATDLPLLWCTGDPEAADAAGADAYLVETARYDDDWERLVAAQERVLDLGLDCVVEARDEEELRDVLEHVDAEILLLGGASLDPGVDALDHVLELLPDVPAGKLAIAELRAASRDDVLALERAGVDAVVVDARDVRALVGAEPPEV
jgi:Indole-3-glycerol phosphate synthase